MRNIQKHKHLLHLATNQHLLIGFYHIIGRRFCYPVFASAFLFQHAQFFGIYPMSTISSWLTSLWEHPLLLLILGLLCLSFGWSIWKAWSLSTNLKSLAQRINEIKDEVSPGQRRTKLTQLFEEKDFKQFKHVWTEYNETLHDQNENLNGLNRCLCSRATAPAGYFFSLSSLVETPLKSDLFKHLPGILTALGIIGTFLGLISGLNQFDTTDPGKINGSVTALLHKVESAFIFSATAIFLATVVTGVEKFQAQRRAAELEKVTEAIDGLFDAGVGEEYLARLVQSSSDNATQTKQLKDSLVEDLKVMLTTLTESHKQQNAAMVKSLFDSQQQASLTMAEKISTSIQEALTEPLNHIAGSIQAVSGDQSSQVQNLLSDVLSAFMDKLDHSFGEQFNHIGVVLNQTVASMTEMQLSFKNLVEDMRHASIDSGKAAQEQIQQTLQTLNEHQANLQKGMADMLEGLSAAAANMSDQGQAAFNANDERQRLMEDQMKQFIESIQAQVGQAQQTSIAEVSASLTQLSEHLNTVLNRFEENREKTDNASQATQQQLHEATRAFVADLSQQTSALLDGLKTDRSASMAAFEQLTSKTEKIIGGMKEGAETMQLAAEQFEAAGDSVTNNLSAANLTLQSINQSTQSLTGASGILSTTLNTLTAESSQNHVRMEKMVTAFESVLEKVTTEAETRSDLVTDFSQIQSKMAEVNQEYADYLEKFNRIISDSFTQFSSGVTQNLEKTLGSLDGQLSRAVNSLASGVENLEEAIESLEDVVSKRQSTKN
jgi:hypothetical protein